MAQSITKLAVLFAAGTATGAAAVWALTSSKEQDVKMQLPATPVSSPSVSFPSHAKDALKLGFPGPVNDVRIREAYATGYDRERRNPKWVVEHLTMENLRRLPPPTRTGPPAPQPGAVPSDPSKPDRSRSTFKEDESIPTKFRARLNDYFRGGFDRGHMCPAADAKTSQDAMNETFLLTNIAPQVGSGFNRDYWAHLEDFCRRLTTTFKDVYVYTVPLYLPRLDESTNRWIVQYQVIGEPVPNVAVPTHFAKIIYALNASNDDAIATFVLPNAPIPDTTPLTEFLTPLDAVERASGLTIFDKIDRRTTGLCDRIKCNIVVRQFKDQQRRL